MITQANINNPTLRYISIIRCQYQVNSCLVSVAAIPTTRVGIRNGTRRQIVRLVQDNKEYHLLGAIMCLPSEFSSMFSVREQTRNQKGNINTLVTSLVP